MRSGNTNSMSDENHEEELPDTASDDMKEFFEEIGSEDNYNEEPPLEMEVMDDDEKMGSSPYSHPMPHPPIEVIHRKRKLPPPPSFG